MLRFGTFHRVENPGFRIRLPNPIERHVIVPVNTVTETEIGGGADQALMLTGDENIVNIDFAINWRISSPQDYLFNVVDVNPRTRQHELIEQVGESAMREVVGTSAFEPITTGDRTGVETRVRDLMQQTLNSYRAGVEVVTDLAEGSDGAQRSGRRAARRLERRAGQGAPAEPKPTPTATRSCRKPKARRSR